MKDKTNVEYLRSLTRRNIGIKKRKTQPIGYKSVIVGGNPIETPIVQPTETQGLIITSGDCSDFDGFLSLPLYYKAALESKMDVAFMMTYPHYLDPNAQTKNKENTYDPCVSDSGKGYSYSFEDWKATLISELNTLDSKLQKSKSELEQIEKINLQLKYFADNSEINITTFKTNLDSIAFNIIKHIWEWCTTNIKIENPPHNPIIYFVTGEHYNTFNPFSPISIKNECDVYKDFINPTIQEVDQVKNVTMDKILELIKNEKLSIYIDMNGSMAWYPKLKKTIEGEENIANFINKVKKCVVMGGVEVDNSIDTMSSVPKTLNRYSTATMNQLYHPDGTEQFFDDFKDKLVFVSNNIINRVFSWSVKEVDYEARLSYLFTPCDTKKNITKYGEYVKDYQNFKTDIDHIIIDWLGITDKKFITGEIEKGFDAYYKERAIDRKPFDLLSSYVLTKLIKNNVPGIELVKYKLFFNKEYGITILQDTDTKILDDKFTFVHYNTQLGKFQAFANKNKELVFLRDNIKAKASDFFKLYEVLNFVGYENNILKNNFNNYTPEPQSVVTEKQGGAGELQPSKTSYIFISDLEGSLPEKLETIIDENVNGLYTNTVIFTGDLIDRGPQSLYLLHKFSTQENIECVVGNRDVNKMRLKHEFYSETIARIIKEKTTLPDMIKAVLADKNMKPEWKYNWKQLKGIIYQKGIYDNTVYIEKNELKNKPPPLYIYDSWSRVEWTFSSTMGAAKAVDFLIEELQGTRESILSKQLDAASKLAYPSIDAEEVTTKEETIQIGNLIEDCNAKYKITALIQMIMSNDWNKDIKIHLNEKQINSNNLYHQYLKKTKLCIMKKIDAYNFAYATHSGLPKSKSKSNNSFNHTLINNIGEDIDYNTSYTKFINDFYKSNGNDIEKRNDLRFETLMKMGCYCGGDVQNTSPIAGYSSNMEDGPYTWETKQYKINDDNFKIENNEIKNIVTKQTFGTSKFINLYNICGHQPVGILPEAGSINNNAFVSNAINFKYYHVRLDVSKAESIDDANKTHFAYLSFTNSDNYEAKIHVNGTHDVQTFNHENGISLLEYINNREKQVFNVGQTNKYTRPLYTYNTTDKTKRYFGINGFDIIQKTK